MVIVLILCLIYMLALICGVMWKIVKSDARGRLNFIKSFKKGKFALIYFVTVPLYFLAYRYNGKSVGYSFWMTIKSSIELVVLKYDYGTVEALLKSNLFYNIVLQIAFALILLNALMFTFSLFGQMIVNAVSLWHTRRFKKKVVVVVGHNANNLDIVKSITKKHGKAVLVGKASREAQDDATINHADYVKLTDENLGQKIEKLFKRFDNKKVSVIVNCEDDKTNIRYINQLYEVIEKNKLTELPLTQECGLQVYVFGSKENESTFVHYVEKSKGLIRFVNRHKQIAMNFVSEYPLTKYMTDKQIDYATSTVKQNVELNVVMIGFGNFNETLFLTSVSNNQFLTMVNGKLQPKPVHYHVFDLQYPYGKITAENTSVHSRNFNHGYNRYAEFLKTANAADYLELPDKPARVDLHPCDVAHPDFYATMQRVLNGVDAYSYVVISFGTDMENLELAKKISQKLDEWSVSSFVKIFVKLHDEKMLKEVRNDFQDERMVIFGTTQSVVYNAGAILNEETELMAKLRHIIYMAEDAKKKKPSQDATVNSEEIERLARDKWYNKYRQFQRESNVFACTSIRMKLQLLGYDYSFDGEDCSEEFETKYEMNDERTPTQVTVDGKAQTLTVQGKQIYAYTNDEQWRNSVRWTYAVQEHQRWCANMICNGLIPATRTQIADNGGRIRDKRIHGNLTTMEGLVEYREIVAKNSGCSVEDADVIRYDYQLMDDVVWLLHHCGYKIVKK